MQNPLLKPLAIRPFLFLWLAEVCSQIATNMFNFVIIIVAFKLAGSNTAVSGIIVSFTVPAILFGMLAGVFVDRWNKKRVLVITSLLRVLLLGVITLFHGGLVLIYIVSFLVSIVAQFFIPAETPMIPLVVKKDNLISANALFGIAMYGSVFLAYALAGPALLFLGQTMVFAILALLFLLATFFASLIHVSKEEHLVHSFLDIKPDEVVGDITSAFHIVRKTKEIYNSLFLLTLSQFIILILAVLGPGYATHVLKVNVDHFSILFVTPAVLGMVVGAVIISNFFQYRNKYKVAGIGTLLAGLILFILPYGAWGNSGNFFLSHSVVILAFILGVANSFVFVPSNTLLQEKTKPEYRGKIYGALNALVGVSSLLPVIIIGELADLFGVSVVLVWIGIAIVVTGVINIIYSFIKQ